MYRLNVPMRGAVVYHEADDHRKGEEMVRVEDQDGHAWEEACGREVAVQAADSSLAHHSLGAPAKVVDLAR